MTIGDIVKMTITQAQIAEKLASGEHFAAHAVSPQMIDRYIEKHRSSDDEISTLDSNARRLMALIEGNLRYFDPVMVTRLKNTEIYVPPSLSMALSWREEERDIIVIGSQLLDLLFATATWQLIVESLPESLNDSQSNRRLKDDFSLLSYALILRSYSHGTPLPDFEASFDSVQFGRHRHLAFLSACLFVLFHELGHLALHSGKPSGAGRQPELLVSENLDGAQAQEFEADAFVLEAIKNQNYSTFQVLTSSALMFFATAETLLATHHAEHPLTMNRINYANFLVDSDGTGPIDVDFYLEQQASVFQSQIEKKVSNDWVGEIFKGEKYWKVVDERLLEVGENLTAYNVDAHAMLTSSQGAWFEILQI